MGKSARHIFLILIIREYVCSKILLVNLIQKIVDKFMSIRYNYFCDSGRGSVW